MAFIDCFFFEKGDNRAGPCVDARWIPFRERLTQVKWVQFINDAEANCQFVRAIALLALYDFESPLCVPWAKHHISSFFNRLPHSVLLSPTLNHSVEDIRAYWPGLQRVEIKSFQDSSKDIVKICCLCWLADHGRASMECILPIAHCALHVVHTHLQISYLSPTKYQEPVRTNDFVHSVTRKPPLHIRVMA